MRNLNCQKLVGGAVLPLVLLLLCLAEGGVQARPSPHTHRRRGLSAVYNQTSPNSTFPYLTCNTSAAWNINPWRAKLDYQQDLSGSTLVVIRVWATPHAHVVNLGQLELYVPVESVLKRFNGSFVDAKISIGNGLNSTNYTGIVWSPHRRMIRFSKLNFSYLVGANTSYKITFTFLNGAMDALCGRSCKYALVNGKRCTLGQLGWVPVIVVEGPDFAPPNNFAPPNAR